MSSFSPAPITAVGIFLADADASELVKIVVYTEEAIEPPVQRPTPLLEVRISLELSVSRTK